MSRYDREDESGDDELYFGCMKSFTMGPFPPTADTKGPAHYTELSVQPWAAMESWMSKDEFCGFLRGNAIKYLARAPRKGGVEDYRKAAHYLEKLLAVLSDDHV